MSIATLTSRRFDGQAAVYDGRTAIDAAAASAAAAVIRELAGAGGLIVEIGAGTGELGRWLAADGPYAGLDLSLPMLARFRAKRHGAAIDLVRAECNRTWPLRDGVASAVVALRVAHQLDTALLATEAQRVCRPGGALLIGRVEHDEASLRGRLRRQRQRLIAAYGSRRPTGEEGSRRLIERCLAAGAAELGRLPVAEWARPASAGAVIAAWDAVDAWGTGSVAPAALVDVQAALRIWAVRTFGSLHHIEPCLDRLVFDVLRFP